MKKLKIYIDTSVIGGCFDQEFSYYSNRLFSEFEQGSKIAVISSLTLDELDRAPDFVTQKLLLLPPDQVEQITILPEMIWLADQYLKQDILTSKFREDALHIAIATVAKVDILVTDVTQIR